MEYRIIPMETYPRRAHFAYFSTMAQPYAGVTVSVEITHFLESVQEKGSPFFLSFLYCVSRAANQVPELRQRIWKGEIIEYQNCPTSHTVALPDGTYCYCMLRSEKPFPRIFAGGGTGPGGSEAPAELGGWNRGGVSASFVCLLPALDHL